MKTKKINDQLLAELKRLSKHVDINVNTLIERAISMHLAFHSLPHAEYNKILDTTIRLLKEPK